MGVLDASTSPLKERYVVSNDNVFKLIQPGSFVRIPMKPPRRSEMMSPGVPR